jgi:hypothetical protein
MTGIDVCARATFGHAMAAPPRSDEVASPHMTPPKPDGGIVPTKTSALEGLINARFGSLADIRPRRGQVRYGGISSLREFLAVGLQFLFYGFDVVPNLSDRIGYFFFCFPEEFAPVARQSWRGNIDAISVQL